jgi:diazepam-binding inhibitor (GABA receptor modulator, acyl-CoA-binding protein)
MSDDAFNSAQREVQELPRKPSNDELLELYALFKQATVGDVSGKRPGALDFKGRAKYDAWSKVAGKPAAAAKTEYVALVARLKQKYA